MYSGGKMKSKLNAAYIIAEVGQNHQGDLNLAKQYIAEFSKLGADAIKFQKRDLNTLFDKDKLGEPYNSENAFAATYGEHRSFLEFDISQMAELQDYCLMHEVDFMCTAFDQISLNQLLEVNCNFIKLASFDMGNIPLIEKAILSGKQIVLSSGGSDLQIISKTYDYFSNHENMFSLLHCVSEYPCEAYNLTLQKIPEYSKLFPRCQIGLSDHFNGTLSGPVGLLMGARIFEKHVTFNRSWQGTDHSFALSPGGFQKFVRDINRTAQMIKNNESLHVLGAEPVFKKLGKSIIAAKEIQIGENFSCNNLTSKILSDPGIPVREIVNLIGEKAARKFKRGEKIVL